MTKTQIIKVLADGGKIGGHSLMLINAKFETVGKVSRKMVEALQSEGLVTVVNQSYKLVEVAK